MNYKDVAGAQVHTGFYQAYDAVSGQVISAVKSILSAHSTAGVFVTGHSLGGALATFAAADIKRNIGNSKITIYTYGSPRTGNQAFTDYLFSILGNGNRVTHYNDIVPHNPPAAFGFNHFADEIWYQNSAADG